MEINCILGTKLDNNDCKNAPGAIFALIEVWTEVIWNKFIYAFRQDFSFSSQFFFNDLLNQYWKCWLLCKKNLGVK